MGIEGGRKKKCTSFRRSYIWFEWALSGFDGWYLLQAWCCISLNHPPPHFLTENLNCQKKRGLLVSLLRNCTGWSLVKFQVATPLPPKESTGIWWTQMILGFTWPLVRFFICCSQVSVCWNFPTHFLPTYSSWVSTDYVLFTYLKETTWCTG